MTIKELSLSSLVGALVLSSACVVSDDPGQDTDTDTNPTTMTASASASNTDTMSDPTVGTSTTNSTDPDTTATGTDTSVDTDTDTDTDTEAGDPDVYDFREDDPGAYTQVDRKGFPAVNTALISSANKDAYNASNPAADVDGTYAAEAVAAVVALHGTPAMGLGLEDDIETIDAALTADLPNFCGVVIGNDSCVVQAVPLAFPDVLLLRTGAAAGFPNGRQLETPVIDIILSALFFELDSPAVLNTLSLLPGEMPDETHGLSQSPNDAEFPGAFPYLAPAHE